MAKFVFFLLILVVVVGLGIYHSAPYWLPGIRDAQDKVNVEAFKAIAAALATAVAALIAAGASVLNVGLQLRAGKSLEQTKRRLAGELEVEKSKLMRELEADKSRYMKELEADKGNLMKELEEHKTQLSIEKAELERKLAWLEKAHEIASNYRYAIGLLRQGQHDVDEIEGLQRKVAEIGDGLARESDLYMPWRIFFQRGHNLNERAKNVKAMRARRDVWNSPSENGRTFGIEFATSAEEVIQNS